MSRTKKVELTEDESIISKELKRYEQKIKDFQDFIEEKPTLANIKIQKELMLILPELLKKLAELRQTKKSKSATSGDLDLGELEQGEL